MNSEEDIAEAQEEDRIRQEKLDQFCLDDWRKALMAPEARSVFCQLLLFARTLEANVAEAPHLIGFHEGQRSVGLEIMRRMQAAAPESYMKAITETRSMFNFFKTATMKEINNSRAIQKKDGFAEW